MMDNKNFEFTTKNMAKYVLYRINKIDRIDLKNKKSC